MTFITINKRIEKIEATRDKLHNKAAEVCKDLDSLKEALIESCDHPIGSVFEIRYYWSFSPTPWIVCIKCGLAEEGWGCGHDVFTSAHYNGLPQTDRKFIEKFVKVERSQEEQFKRRQPEMHYQTDLEGNTLKPKDWIRIPKPFHDNWEERKHLKR